jgi:RAD51-like protein 2
MLPRAGHADVGFARRQQLVAQMAQALSTLAVHHSLAVVLANHVTTKVNDALGTASLVPALGETWAHVCNVQVSLQWRDGQRIASLYKGLAPGEACYRVTAEGIRSAYEPTETGHADTATGKRSLDAMMATGR